MSTLFKDEFNSASICYLGEAISQVWPEFDHVRFVTTATKHLSSLAMKARSNQIVTALSLTLPDDFTHAAQILTQALAPTHSFETSSSGWTNNIAAENGIGGWLIMPCADYIALHGNTQEHFSVSMCALHAMTKRFSAEFAIRPFIAAMPEQIFATLEHWINDPDKHVRRLVSEGSRPRLPWGIRLQAQIKDPTPTLPLLEQLKNDPEDYVRLSVANHLNDIAKDHPDLVNEIAGRWLNEEPTSTTRVKLVKHACRTLIKQGNTETLRLLGYEKANVSVEFTIQQDAINMGQSITLECRINNPTDRKQRLLLDYIVHHQKANGTTSPKVFKWKTLTIEPNTCIVMTKQHSFKPVTTRKYYSGKHRLDIQINGQPVAHAITYLTS